MDLGSFSPIAEGSSSVTEAVAAPPAPFHVGPRLLNYNFVGGQWLNGVA